MLHNGDASTQDPVFLPPMFLFFRLRLSNDHGLRDVHLRVAAAVPLCHTWFIVYKVLRVSHRKFCLPAFLPVCRPDKGAVQLEANGPYVSLLQFRSRERSEVISCLTYVTTPLPRATPTLLCVNRRPICHHF